MRNGGGRATDWLDVRRCEAMRVLLDKCEEKAWRLGSQWRYWSSLAALMKADVPSAWTTAERPEVQELMAEYLPRLIDAFGAVDTLTNLWSHTGTRSLKKIVEGAYPNGVPPKIRMILLKITIRSRYQDWLPRQNNK